MPGRSRVGVGLGLALAWLSRMTALAGPVPARSRSGAVTSSRILRDLHDTAKKGLAGLARSSNLWRAFSDTLRPWSQSARRSEPLGRESGPLRGEALASGREPVEERCGRPEGIPALVLEFEQPVAQCPEPDRIGPEHGTASIDGPAVAVDPDHVDVAGADSDLLIEDLGALVDHRIEEPLQDLLVGDRAAGD